MALRLDPRLNDLRRADARLASRLGAAHVADPSAPMSMSAGYSLYTSPVVPQLPGAPTWDRWVTMDTEYAAAEAGMSRDGVTVRTDVPMGQMDMVRANPGLTARAKSRRGKRALREMPWWRRVIAELLLWIAAIVGRLAHWVGGGKNGGTSTVLEETAAPPAPPPIRLGWGGRRGDG